MSWSHPTLEEIRKALGDGGYDYRTSPSIDVLLEEVDRLREALMLIACGEYSTSAENVAAVALAAQENK